MLVPLQDGEVRMNLLEEHLYSAASEVRNLDTELRKAAFGASAASGALMALCTSPDGMLLVGPELDLTTSGNELRLTAAEHYTYHASKKAAFILQIVGIETDTRSRFEGLFFDLSLDGGEKMKVETPFDHPRNLMNSWKSSVSGSMSHIDLRGNRATVILNKKSAVAKRPNFTTVPILNNGGGLAINLRRIRQTPF